MTTPRTLAEHAGAWEQRLHELVGSLDVPGATLGVSWRGERVVFAAGVTGLRSRSPVTEGTVFQLGSISKVYTATLLARLTGLDDALLERPVSELVPEAGWMSPAIRVRHLLTHSSGLGGDHFADTGRGDDALSRYVAELEAVAADHPGAPGERYSYCNSGFAVLGRAVEALTGATYDAALREQLTGPLGVPATSGLPEEAILWPVAVGHNRADPVDATGGRPGPLCADDVWCFPRSCTPLGGICAPAGEVLGFAEMHLRDGVGGDGRRVLAPGVAARMRERHLECPPRSRPSARGLGWGVYDWRGGTLVGHDGETTGQIAKLRLVCEQDLAVVVLTNGIPDGNRVCRELETLVLGAWGLERPVILAAPADPRFDPAPYVGRYRNREGTIEVTAIPGGLRARFHQEAEGLDGGAHVTELRPVGEGGFVDAGEPRPQEAVHFGDRDGDGRCRSYFDGRVSWRLADDASER